MTVGAEAFTAITYGLLALVGILYLLLLRAFWVDDPEDLEEPEEFEESAL